MHRNVIAANAIEGENLIGASRTEEERGERLGRPQSSSLIGLAYDSKFGQRTRLDFDAGDGANRPCGATVIIDIPQLRDPTAVEMRPWNYPTRC
jgi:hypothetical protein